VTMDKKNGMCIRGMLNATRYLMNRGNARIGLCTLSGLK
jgi:hypothetical protein